MPYTWIKAYTEILDDPKMGRMSDHLWRRTLEVFLLAGRQAEGGRLPALDEMAWTLHAEPEALAQDLAQIEAAGIVRKDGSAYTVANFAKRQKAMTDIERQNKSRGVKAKVTNDNEIRHDYVTSCDKNVTEEEVEEEVEEELRTDRDIQKIAQKLSDSKFKFNPNSGTIMQMWADDFQDPVIIRAIDEALAHGANSITYVDKILINWKANGVPPTREEQLAAAKAKKGIQPNANTNNTRPATQQEPTDADRELAAIIRAKRDAQFAALAAGTPCV